MSYEREPWEFEKPTRRVPVARRRAPPARYFGENPTAYDASVRLTGDYHAVRREATRLVERGFLVKDGTLPNRAPRGRKHVDAYRLTEAGRVELQRLGEWP